MINEIILNELGVCNGFEVRRNTLLKLHSKLFLITFPWDLTRTSSLLRVSSVNHYNRGLLSSSEGNCKYRFLCGHPYDGAPHVTHCNFIPLSVQFRNVKEGWVYKEQASTFSKFLKLLYFGIKSIILRLMLKYIFFHVIEMFSSKTISFHNYNIN